MEKILEGWLNGEIWTIPVLFAMLGIILGIIMLLDWVTKKVSSN